MFDKVKTAALVLGIVACVAETPTTPMVQEPLAAELSLGSSGSVQAAGIEDAIDRLLPALDRRTQRLARPVLSVLADAAARGDSATIARSFHLWARVEQDVSAAVASDPDFGAIRHAVRTVSRR